jgi:hypothetical protein
MKEGLHFEAEKSTEMGSVQLQAIEKSGIRPSINEVNFSVCGFSETGKLFQDRKNDDCVITIGNV